MYCNNRFSMQICYPLLIDLTGPLVFGYVLRVELSRRKQGIVWVTWTLDPFFKVLLLHKVKQADVYCSSMSPDYFGRSILFNTIQSSGYLLSKNAAVVSHS